MKFIHTTTEIRLTIVSSIQSHVTQTVTLPTCVCKCVCVKTYVDEANNNKIKNLT